jgi:16S rRNA (cytosine967-C5)-methyltransferase
MNVNHSANSRLRPRARPPGTAALVLSGAARAVAAVLGEGQSAEAALAGNPHDPQRAAVQAVTLGTLRWYLRLAPAALPLLARSVAVTDPKLRSLLVCAAHQLEYSTHAPATTVAAAVDAARLLGFERAAGLVNAILRRFLREHLDLLAAVDRDQAARHAHPDWLVAALRAAWPEELEQLLVANNGHPPLSLRVDLGRTGIADYLQELAARGLAAEAVPGVPTAAMLALALPVTDIPGFAEGRVSVQDPSAQLAALWLAPRPGERVLDACAAPGGKSGALLEVAGGPIALTAVDSDAVRLARVGDNLRRLGRAARLVQADLSAPPAWWDGAPFDAILLDAPCSGTGVIRRHPDIKLLRRASDIAGFAARQSELLRACWLLLRRGGRLLYATCSVLPAENAAVVSAFLAATPGASVLPVPEPWRHLPLHSCVPGWQVLPGAAGDGFYYACLHKEGDAP